MTKGAVRAEQRRPAMKGLGLPMPERSFGAQALTFEAASAQPRHFRCCSGLIEEDQPVRFEPHPRLPLPCPFLARLADVGTIAFAGQQGFFYSDNRCG
jgi:hypothetical protein